MTVLKPYPEYKESGVPWLGRVPGHWEVLPVRAITKTKAVRGRPDLPLLSVYREHGVILRSSRDDNDNPESGPPWTQAQRTSLARPHDSRPPR